MEYIYLIENMTETDGIIIPSFQEINILCYHITTNKKYPFIQFLLEKSLKEGELSFPKIIYFSNDNYVNTILIKVKELLNDLHCQTENINIDMYKGLLIDDLGNWYMTINISDINIDYLNIQSNNKSFFVLASEIINIKNVCNISISKQVSLLFCQLPELSLIYNNYTIDPYIIPDVGYTCDEYKQVEFQAIFGNKQSNIHWLNDDMFYVFYTCFNDAISNGGWCSDKKDWYSKSGRLLVDNDFGRYKNVGVNRYAIFNEVPSVVYVNNQTLDIDDCNNNDCIIVLKDDNCTNVLIKKYELYADLSFHKLSKKTLGEKCDNNLFKDKYQIL